MSNRTAPASGYDFGNKRAYRRRVWSAFDKWIGPDKATIRALLMPSSEGDEVEVAKAHGFREEMLHIVDANTAITATLKRRRFPSINAHGGDCVEVLAKLMNRGIRPSVVNLDLCGHSESVCKNVFRLVNAYSGLTRFPIIAITTLRGRESNWNELRPMLSHVSSFIWGSDAQPDVDALRCAAIGSALYTWCPRNGYPLLLRSFQYRSGTQHMLVTIWTLLLTDQPVLSEKLELAVRLQRLGSLSPIAEKTLSGLAKLLRLGNPNTLIKLAQAQEELTGHTATTVESAIPRDQDCVINQSVHCVTILQGPGFRAGLGV